MKLVSVAEMLAIEKEADASGFTYAQMMENAGRGLAEVVQELELDNEERQVLGLVGPGNNGGDTLVALSHLVADGWRARAYVVRRTSDTMVERLERAGGEAVFADQDPGYASLEAFVQTADVVLDGVLGTGTKPPLTGEVALVLAAMQRILADSDISAYVIAVDCPSGMDCDTGAVAEQCIAADLTVTMAAVKQGLLKLPAYPLIGDLQVVDIGLPPGLRAMDLVRTEVAEEDLVAGILPARPVDAHKGTFGTSVIVAGSLNYSGAALLAGKAAYRSGAGLVTLAVPAALHAVLAGHLPEATWVLLPHEIGVISRDAVDVLMQSLDRATAVLVGPGLGTEDTTRDFLARLLAMGGTVEQSSGRLGFIQADGEKRKPKTRTLPAAVVDADGLKLLAKIEEWHKLLRAPAVLTPHPGEMAILTGLSTAEIQRDREAVAIKYAREWGHVVVLKGAFTIVASPDGKTTVIPIASAALARAGTGDVLAGLIVGLRAQGVEAFQAAVAGAWIHAQAGLDAGRRLGSSASVLAGDVLESVADVMGDLAG